MNDDEIYRELRDADPASSGRMACLELEAAEAALAEAIISRPLTAEAPEITTTPWPSASRRPRRGILGIAGIAIVAAMAAVLLHSAGSDPGAQSKAYPAELVRFAESSPLLLLEEPGWRVGYANQESAGEGELEFIRGRKLPPERISEGRDGVIHGLRPPTVRQRRAELNWRNGPLRPWLGDRAASADFRTTAAVLGTTADVFRYEDGHPGDYEFTALWAEAGRVLEFRAPVPDLAAFDRRLSALRRVGSQRWLEAMPASVIEAASHGRAVTAMLKGIPLPAGFKASEIPDAGLTTDRYQLGAAVAGTVACRWFRQWGEDRDRGDEAGVREAELALAGAQKWPILREMRSEGAYPQVVEELAAAMPSGEFFGRPLLAEVGPALGCAARGIQLHAGPAG
jgi:hypothetical protein